MAHPELDQGTREAVKKGRPFVGMSGDLLKVTRGKWFTRMVTETADVRIEEWGLAGIIPEKLAYVQWEVRIEHDAITQITHVDEGASGSNHFEHHPRTDPLAGAHLSPFRFPLFRFSPFSFLGRYLF